MELNLIFRANMIFAANKTVLVFGPEGAGGSPAGAALITANDPRALLEIVGYL